MCNFYNVYNIYPLVGNKAIEVGILVVPLINTVQYVPLLSHTPIFMLSLSVKYMLPVIQSTAISDNSCKPLQEICKN